MIAKLFSFLFGAFVWLIDLTYDAVMFLIHGRVNLSGSEIVKAVDSCGACGDGCKGKGCRVEAESPPVSYELEPVEGDLLPQIGERVQIHLASRDKLVSHTVVGYYVWGDLKKEPNLHRVFVRVADDDGYLNARLLSDVRRIEQKKDMQP